MLGEASSHIVKDLRLVLAEFLCAFIQKIVRFAVGNPDRGAIEIDQKKIFPSFLPCEGWYRAFPIQGIQSPLTFSKRFLNFLPLGFRLFQLSDSLS
jgi:hypothetical protein